ncbi:MAG: gliding motility-associated C-terminal domain-containing protein [Dinghuibacter sp.]|nr:gliding motility-associated C-terminal domain-containing protein [Dinghuibacter sp.]
MQDLQNRKVEFVYYQAKVGGQQVFITNYGLSILLSRVIKTTRLGDEQKSNAPSALKEIFTYELERVDIVLQGAKITPAQIQAPEQTQTPQINMYIESAGKEGYGLHLHKEILVKNIYPGIDWKIYIHENGQKKPCLKYDFIIHPGADASLIAIRYSNNARLQLDNNEINAVARMGTLTESKPFSYLQENQAEVKVVYQLNDNTIRFNTPGYDKNKTLVIDPSIFWLTYLTAINNVPVYQSINGHDVETDSSGNIFVLLTARGNAPFPTVNPGGGAYYQTATAAPNGAMVILKFAPGGQMLWSTYFGNGIGGHLITIDKFGNLVVLGRRIDDSPSYPNPNPSIPLLNNGGYFDTSKKQFCLARFSNSGVLMWSTYYVNFSSLPSDMTYDINGNFYVTGWSQMWDFPVVDPGGGAYMVNNAQQGAQQVLFIAQFDAACSLKWSTRIEGNDYDPYSRICTDKQGNIYLGGQTRSTNYPLVNAGGYFINAPQSSVLTRFNAARQMTWSTYFPGIFSFADLTVDDSSNLYVAADRRILKFNSNTQLVYTQSVNTPRMYFWNKINFDMHTEHVQLLGVMNDNYWQFPTVNTACNGSFFDDGLFPNNYSNATGPIFATLNRDGVFTYRSLTDWPYEYYDYNEMAIDQRNGDMIYLFGDQRNGFVAPNPQLTDPGNGAYFNIQCCSTTSGSGRSAMLLKLKSSELSVTTQINAASNCTCNGTATAIPQCGLPPFTYLWSNGATTASVNNLCPGQHWVKVTDANGLSRTVFVTMPYPPGSITQFASAIIPENCNRQNGSITVTMVQGGATPYTYSRNGINYFSSPQFTGLDSGSYIIRVKDANGCVFSDTLNVSRIPGPYAITHSTVNSTCSANDGQISVTNVQGGVGPYQYTLAGGNVNSTGLFTGLAQGSYQLTVSDTAGCSYSKIITVNRAAPPADAVITVGNDHCNRNIGFIQVTGVTGGQPPYSFSTDSSVFVSGPLNGLAAGSYPVYIKDNNGCVLKKGPVVIANVPGPDSVSINIQQAICGQTAGSLEIINTHGGVSPYQYAIDNGVFTASGNYTGITPGNHQLHVKDAFGCVFTRNFQVQFVPVPHLTLIPADSTICYGETLTLSLSGDLNQVRSINWNIPAQGSTTVFRATQNQTISVTITDQNNCTIRDSSKITVKACSTPEKCLVIPTAFTPNNDAKNETIGPLTNGCRVKELSFRVYNRWGHLLFETNDLIRKWDGRFKETPQPVGAYIFYCSYVTDDGIRRQQKGTFALIR